MAATKRKVFNETLIKYMSKYRYDELKAFSRQYEEKAHEMQSALDIQSPRYDNIRIQTGKFSDPVYKAMIIREWLRHDLTEIERAAESVDNGKWTKPLILHVGYGVPYDRLSTRCILPTFHRAAFFNAKDAFFIRLNQIHR